MNVRTNIDDVRARMMALESASVFDEQAWQRVLADLRAGGRVSALADAERRMETARLCQHEKVNVKYLGEQPGHRKRWMVNGREVITWSDYDCCLRCGHKLTSAYSRARGYGSECRSKRMYEAGPVAVLVVSAETAGVA